MGLATATCGASAASSPSAACRGEAAFPAFTAHSGWRATTFLPIQLDGEVQIFVQEAQLPLHPLLSSWRKDTLWIRAVLSFLDTMEGIKQEKVAATRVQVHTSSLITPFQDPLESCSQVTTVDKIGVFNVTSVWTLRHDSKRSLGVSSVKQLVPCKFSRKSAFKVPFTAESVSGVFRTSLRDPSSHSITTLTMSSTK